MVAGQGVAAICFSCAGKAASILGVGPPEPEAGGRLDLNTLSLEQLFERIRGRAATVRQADGEVRRVVAILRRRRVTWELIGEALGISRQSAWERFSR